jgi:hypothetical protein
MGLRQAGRGRSWMVSEQLVWINNDLFVARRAVKVVVGAYPDGSFWRGLMTPRAML